MKQIGTINRRTKFTLREQHMSGFESTSRRGFLASTALTAVAVSAKSYAQIAGANERISIGFIGAGGMGTNHLKACKDLKKSDNLQFLGVADCWKTRAEKGAKLLET